MNIKKISDALLDIITAFSLRLFGFFFNLFFKRNSNTWLFYGRNGRFIDNTKYLALWVAGNIEKKPNIIFIHTLENPPSIPGIKFARKNSLLELFYLCTSGYVFVDVVDQLVWEKRIFFCKKAKIVQLWHGVFLKKRIELISHKLRLEKLSKTKQILLDLHTKITLRFPKYDYFVSTSKYYTDEVFKDAFQAKKFLNYGYPRNDYLIRPDDFNKDYVIDKFLYDLICALEAKKHKKTILYTPTFRSYKGEVIKSQGLSIQQLNYFGEKLDCVFVIKPHPWDLLWDDEAELENAIVVKGDIDIYPLFKKTDILITDYSSISYDFLITNKPIIFFPYDKDEYIDNNDNLMFNYDERTPGHKVYSSIELYHLLSEIIYKGTDGFESERSIIRTLAFDDFHGNACKKIYEELKPEGIAHA